MSTAALSRADGLVFQSFLRYAVKMRLVRDQAQQMNHWSNHAKQWDLIGAPLRPSPQDVDRIKQGLEGCDSDPVLVLGVTPELTEAFPHVVAVDKNPDMLRGLWKDGQGRSEAVCSDWLTLDLRGQIFTAVVGDGCFTVLGSATNAEVLMNRLNSGLKPGTSLRFRLFIRPEKVWSLEELQSLTLHEAPINFHAFKWMMAMHLSAYNQDSVNVRDILGFFNEYWPDRRATCKVTGWNPDTVSTIDAYHDSQDVYWFPTMQGFIDLASIHFASLETAISSGYDLCEHCPILAAETKGL